MSPQDPAPNAHAENTPEPTPSGSETLSLALNFDVPAPPQEVQAEIPLAPVVKQQVSWGERAMLLEREIAALNAGESRFASRNLLIVQMWADRARGDSSALEKICRYAKTNKFVMQWVLKTARKGDYNRLVRKAKAGRKGKRQQVLVALSQGVPPKEVEVQFGLHRTSVLRAQQQLKRLGGKIAA